nr:MAG TPA: hypothetical protein [Caudoviricetes sp.]
MNKSKIFKAGSKNCQFFIIDKSNIHSYNRSM